SSTGEEPYTLIMVLEEFRKRYPNLKYNLLASDVSLRVMQTAYNGIYTVDKIAGINNELKRNYFLRSKIQQELVRIKPQFRRNVTYKRINLINDSFGLHPHGFDVIFCRNVLIYFDKQRQESVIRKFAAHLRPGGLLFLGHSESIMGMDVPFKQIRPTTYQRIG
ncbi:CheR family methyltransferase, partial [Chryseosolibacter indicus]